MNINQIGQKKKKQAVRRLSQPYSGGHGNRKDDLRRKLGSVRRGAEPGSEGSDRRFPRGSIRQGRTEENFEIRPFGPGVKRNIGHPQTSSKRHASPLASTVSFPTGNTDTQETTNVFAQPTVAASSVSGGDISNPYPTRGNGLGRFQSKNRTWINETTKQPQQETQKVFGSNSSPNEGNVFGRKQFETTNTLKSKPSDKGNKFHPSPLAGFSNSSNNAGGSIISGLANPNIGQGNVSSLVGKYDQNTTQSFPASSGSVFQSAISSQAVAEEETTNQPTGLQSTNAPQSNNVFPGKDTYSGSSLASNPGSVFASNSGMPTMAPPNVNLFATGQNENPNTMTTQNSTSNTTFFSGMARVESKSGIFGSSMNPANSTSGGVLNFNKSTNPIGATSPAQSLYGVPVSKGSVFGNAELAQSSSQQASTLGTPTLATHNTTTQNTLQNKPTVFGNIGLPESSNQQASIFETPYSVAANVTPQNSSQSIFGGAGLTSPVGTRSSILYAANQSSNSPLFNSKPFSNTGSVFGGASLPANLTDFGTYLQSSHSGSQNNSAKGSEFGNAGIPVTSTTLPNVTSPFASHGSASPAFTKPGRIFGSAGTASDAPILPGKASVFTLNKTSTDPVVGSNTLVTDRATSSAAIFEGGGSPVTSTELTKNTGPFASHVPRGSVSTKPAGIFGGAGTPPEAQTLSGVFTLNKASADSNVPFIAPATSSKPASVFGSPDFPVTSTAFPKSTSPFTASVPSGPASTKPSSIFGSAPLSKASDSPRTPGQFSRAPSTNQGPFTTGTKASNSSFIQLPGSIFGGAGLATASDIPQTSGIFSVSQATNQGPFTSKVSNPSFTQLPGGIFGGQSSTFSSQSVFSNPSGVTAFGSDATTPVNSAVFQNPKSVRRSLSNTDVSDLTSILIKGLAEEFFDKKLLEKEFKIFGANKISLQPTKQSAVVNFATHDSAKKAKSRASELFPGKDTHVFWYKKKGTGRTSRTPEKLTGNKREFRSRRMSISNALNSIDMGGFSPALSAQERFTVLEEVDKRIRQAITPYTHIASSPVIIGVCCDMCPEKERYMREFQVNLSIFEMVPGTQDNRDGDVPKVEHTKAVKEYSRSAADKLEPLAHELRPVHVLQMTLDYLMAAVMNNSGEKWGEWFNFLWNRTRAIRKDITQQHLCDAQSADLVEKVTRFHIFCAHYLCEEDMHSFDPKINNENLTKCLQTLKQFYVDLYTDQEVKCPKEAEFQAYDILLNLNEGDTLRKAMQYHPEVRNSPKVKFALEVFSSLNSQNFVRFFKLLNSASYLNACIMHRYFTQVRRSALMIMSKAYSPKEPLPLQVLQDLLAFEDKNETSRFCSHYNFTTTEDSVQFSRGSFTDPETVFPLQRASNVIESKRNYSIGEVVNGSPLMNRAIHEPVSSFDSNGRYVGLENLVQMLRSTPDTPESPHYIYEPPANTPTEQRSPVVAKPTDDPRVVFAKAIESTCLDLVDHAVDELLKEISEDAIRQVDLQLQVTELFAGKFINDSVLCMLKEIAKECITKEVETKRRNIAVVESRARMSVLVLNEIMDDVIKTELVSLAGNAKREIRQQMKAQSFAKMSAVIMREMLEDVVYDQSKKTALATRKEIVKQKKAMLWSKAEILHRNQLKKYFNTWSKEYHTRVHIRNILQQIPAIPPMLTAKQQLEKLLSTKGSTANLLHITPLPSISVLKDREEVQKRLADMVNKQQMKRLRAMQPINLTRLYKELATSRLMSMKTKRSDVSNWMKLVVSFPGHVEHFSSKNSESLIKFKLRAENADKCRPVAAEFQGKFEQLSAPQETLNKTCEFKYDIKACYGIVSANELKKVQRQHLLLGMTGVLFILNSDGQIKDKMFWSNCRTRLRKILRSKPPVPRIPLVVMDTNTRNTDRQSSIEEQLRIDELRGESLLSNCAVYYVQQESMDSDELHKQLVHAIIWLMSHSPETPAIEKDFLKGFVEKEILKHFTIPVYEEIALRKKAFLQPQCPEVIVDLYNYVIDHVIGMVTNVKLKDISLPVPEFNETDSTPVSWNSSGTHDRLHSILRKLKLPMPPSPAADGTWHSEYMLCMDYIDSLLDEEPLKSFRFALVDRVERILSPYSTDEGHLSPTTLTAADIPWPQVVEACIKTLLTWFQTLSGDGDTENVYYLPEDLEEFNQPALWTEAVSETFKLVKESSVKRKKKMTPKLCDLTTEVEEELTRIETDSRSRLDVSERESFVDDDLEENTRRFERNLAREKRNSKRFEDELRSMLDEDDFQDLSVNGQGVKRKYPSWNSGFRSEKTNVKKSSATVLEDLNLPDLNSTRGYFETSLTSLRDGLEVYRHLEELTERKLREALDDSFE